jgi:hypothetical protein
MATILDERRPGDLLIETLRVIGSVALIRDLSLPSRRGGASRGQLGAPPLAREPPGSSVRQPLSRSY